MDTSRAGADGQVLEEKILMPMRTQAEAEKTWCPHARVVYNFSSPPANKFRGDSEIDIKCCGIRCSQWRLEPVHDIRERELYSKRTGARVTGTTSDDADWRLKNPDEPMPEAKGWCGLAGRPGT